MINQELSQLRHISFGWILKHTLKKAKIAFSEQQNSKADGSQEEKEVKKPKAAGPDGSEEL